MEVKIINKSNNPLPVYSTEHSAGMDLRANLNEKLTLKPNHRTLIYTGLFVQLPVGYEAQIRPRSGLALKYGVTVLNSPGTIDSDYTGELGVILINHGNDSFEINNGDRVAQMVVSKHETVKLIEVNKLGETERGEGGFGHTGKQ